MRNKKGLFGGPGGGPRQPVSLFLGLAFLALGIIPLLFQFNVIQFNLPGEVGGVVLWVLATVGGIVLLWDALSEQNPMGFESQLRLASLIAALILLGIGVIPILHAFAVIGFTYPPFVEVIFDVLFVVVGLLLLYGSTKSF